jgi:hypothetical protein
MFDATSWPKPEPPRRQQRPRPRRRALVTASSLFTLVLTGAAASLASPPLLIISAPSHLRQIEISQNPFHETLKIYLANAGFRDIHKHRLLAAVTGATSWRVVWQSDNAATILLRPACATVERFSAPGISIKFAT